ncbi:hypothetical protein EJ03DRAFT_77815 [Teratosphaeria nubilosa]|uniref:Apple domain-containing protein n=1 Tax=Teratosphaeria nubilosa TaxID=161662 RepID=A0A6G1LBJ6_9PEZI|nr:hypothetical protein EJ03DRAFT_77815 [Teratosphaeria nubilosa]
MRLSTIELALKAASIFSLAAAQTYSCPAQNNTLITDSSGRQYIIGCGSDTLGGSVTSTAVNSFNDCFAACDSYSGCTAFTFTGPTGASTGTAGAGNCYIKTSNNIGFVAGSSVDIAGILYGPSYYYIGNPSPNFVCPNDDNTVVYDYNQTQWALKCSSDTNTGSTGTAPTAEYNFDDCFVFCEDTPGCTAFTYSGQAYGAGTGTCYLQAGSTETFASSDVNHVAAIKLANFGGTKGSTTLAYTMGGPAITTYSASSSTSAASSLTSTSSSTTSTTSTTSSTSSSSITASASYVTSAYPVVTVTTTKGVVVTYTAYYTTVVRKRDLSYSTATVGME